MTQAPFCRGQPFLRSEPARMSTCQACNRPLTLFEGQLPPAPGDQVKCPYCGEEQTIPEQHQRLTPIARINNLADVGYLEDCLHQAGIEHHVQQREEFSALTGGWEVAFVLQVPEEQAEAAAQVLRQATRNDPPAEDESRTTLRSEETVRSQFGWLPIALALAACGLIYLSLRWPGVIVQRGGGAASQQDDLTEALREIRTPLTNNPAAGETLRRLYFDPATQQVVLDEDTDGDGRYDRRRFFRNGRRGE